MNNRKGFTLIELLVYIGVSTILLIALAGFVFSLFGTYRQSSVRSAQQNEISNLSARLQQEIGAAYAIDPTSVFSVDMATTPSASIVLHTRNTSEDPIIFSVVQEQLLLKKGNETAIPFHSSNIDVTSLIFTDQSVGSSAHVGIDMTVSTPVGFGLPDAQTQATFTIELNDYAP